MATSNRSRSGPRARTAKAPAAAGTSATVVASNVPAVPGRLLDARPDRLDFRDLPYRPPLRSLPACFPAQADVTRFISSYVQEGLVLDQGREGACTGFGLACVANYLLWVGHHASGSKKPFLPVSPRMFYELAKRYDEWPGDDYEGSSCRGALKGWHKHGVCSAENWPYSGAGFVRPLAGWDVDAARRPLGVYYRVASASVVDLQAAIVNIGAVYVSAGVHDGWTTLARGRATAPPAKHDDLPGIPAPVDPRKLGGHAFALVGYNERGFVVQNSWGGRWGAAGFAVLPYEDWVAHGTDAWACALGVPLALTRDKGRRLRPLHASAFRVASGQSLNALDRFTRAPNNPADDPWPVDHSFLQPAYEPLTTAQAYELTLVTGNDGELVPTDFTRAASDRDGLAQEIVCERPLAWLAGQQPAMRKLKLAVYAHGGLNNEEESIRRIRVLAPYFLANGVYPLFLTWKTGAGETLAGMAQDWMRKLFGVEAERAAGLLDALGDAKDRAIEALAFVLGKGVWSQMRDNAAASASAGHGLDLLSRQLAALATRLQAQGNVLELHLIGHSAGAILLGHLLDRMVALNAQAGAAAALQAASCTLFAPACSSQFAVGHYLPAALAGALDLRQLRLHVLSDANEKKDGLPTPRVPAYGKSLLYLVSRALDDLRKQPLLGMERALNPAYANDDEQWDVGALPFVQQWLATWPGAAQGLLDVLQPPRVRNTREGNQVQATHGSFDNNIDVLTALLERLAGGALIGPMEWLDY
ncbi:C1 family peptidase [Variovorax fucosicus]|uniref:C1 family peptidase n=1 Tax=Variovorax fucosicus TaxID=3053517 RepID=UPI002578601B|nr:C1 family peptidase [Variovorax sp. J22G47]MDM0057978.1 C1 family peptidase [Variovorax sp. J22G47]